MHTYLHHPYLLTPLGDGLSTNFEQVKQQHSSLHLVNLSGDLEYDAYISRFDDIFLQERCIQYQVNSRFDALLLEGVTKAMQQNQFDATDPNNLIILASTKGNVELLGNSLYDPEQVSLQASAKLLASYLNHPNPVLVVSNACISGISALIVAKRLLDHNQYNQVLVLGCDVISEFIFKGFQSFKALDKSICKPFDKHRSGLNLGEAFASVVVSKEASSLRLLGGLISNDSNHISGPSKTGEELARCISYCHQLAENKTIDFIAAHGTATPYNDEMESKAIDHAGLNQVPVFSLKAIYGHTLGAAGLLETLMGCSFLEHHYIPPSFGFSEYGVPVSIHIATKEQVKPLHRFIKTGSGFGGCNAALAVEKIG